MVFHLGWLVSFRGPGLSFIIPLIEKMVRVDLRMLTLNVSPQDVITRDNVEPRGLTAVAPLHTLRRAEPSGQGTHLALIHGFTPVAFCEGG